MLFCCHGNICRSPMAEFVMKSLLEKQGIAGVVVESAATSSEEIGNPVHRGTAQILDKLGIDYSKKRARRLTNADYRRFDVIIAMERFNIPNILRAAGIPSDTEGKIHLLLDFTDNPRDIDDPWYTGDFDSAFRDISEGCSALLEHLKKEGKV